jgi:DNA-binding response OmpR family regulator
MSSTILIADDEPNILISLEYLMKREGYAGAAWRATGRRRWTPSARAARPGAAGRDDAGKTGFEVCQECAPTSDPGRLKILMLTAKGRDTDVAKGLGVGADAYMTKPFSTKDLAAEGARAAGA